MSKKMVRRKTRSIKKNSKTTVMNTIDPLPYGATGMGMNFGFPGIEGSPFTPQISDVTTSFINLRWYLVSNFRQFLSEAYAEISLVQTLCKVPVQDALRGGIEVKSKQLSEDEIAKLKTTIQRDNDLMVIAQAEEWKRLYGGSGIIILTNQDPETPLNVNTIKEDDRLEFRAVDMWELFWSKQDTDGIEQKLEQESEMFDHFIYYGERIHKSRVIKLKGTEAPSFIRPRLRGWGLSVVEPLIRSLNQYLKSTDLTFEVLDEFKVDVYGIKNLVNILLTPDGGNEVKKRVTMLNYLKNYQNAIVLDSEDTHTQKQLSFAGVADIMQQIRMQIAADLRMPMLKLFGTPASGLNASDEESLEVYNNMVDSEIRLKLCHPILRMLELKCQSLFGYIPEDLEIEFKPLRDLSAVDQETVKTAKYNRLLQAVTQGLLSKEEFRDACNKGDLFDITLDNSSLDSNVMVNPETEPNAEIAEPTPVEPKEGEPRLNHLILVNTESDMEPKIENPGHVDEAIWERAKKAVQKTYGTIHWPIVTHVYEEMGGKFSHKAA